jgi:transcriptional/translational regulatory protein YebC/TACO1
VGGGGSGSVNWQFEQKGVIGIEVTVGMSVDDVSLMAIDAGAEDVKEDKDISDLHQSGRHGKRFAGRWKITALQSNRQRWQKLQKTHPAW